MSDNRPTCNVCNKKESITVCCSSLSPTSYAYCSDCHSNRLEPWGELVAAGFCTDCKSKKDLYRVFSRDFIKKMVSFHSKSTKELLKEIKKTDDEFNSGW